MPKTIKNIAWHILVVSIFLLLCIPLKQKRSYNWDMLAYGALVLNTSSKSFDDTHQRVYQETKERVSENAFNRLIGQLDSGAIRTFGVNRDVTFRKDMYAHPDMFKEQLAFYDIKILYVTAIGIFHRLGLNVIEASILPSLLGFIFCGWLMFYWINRKFNNPVLALGVCLVVFNLPLVFSAARIVSPDFFCACFLFTAAYLTTFEKRSYTVVISLVIAILIRTDSVLFALPLLGLPLIWTFFKDRQILKSHIIGILVLISASMLHHLWSSNPGWPTLFKHSFYAFNNYPISSPVSSVSFSEYYPVLIMGLKRTVVEFRVYMLLTALYFYWQLHRHKWTFYWLFEKEHLVIISLVVYLSTRFLLFPIIEDRLLIGAFLPFVTIAICALRTPRTSQDIV